MNSMYPVGSIYVSVTTICPLAALISGSVWTNVGSGKVLWGKDESHNLGDSIEAGLPNITGNVYSTLTVVENHTINAGECLKYSDYYDVGVQMNDKSILKCYTLFLDASLSSTIYGNSNTVQPPAYVVNFFQRTA